MGRWSCLIRIVTEIGDPDSYKEAIKVDDHRKWITAMKQEIKSLDKNQAWTLIDLLKDSKAIGCRWVFCKKDNEQYKVRLVAKRYAQKEGIDYNEIFFSCSQAYIYSDVVGDSCLVWSSVGADGR